MEVTTNIKVNSKDDLISKVLIPKADELNALLPFMPLVDKLALTTLYIVLEHIREQDLSIQEKMDNFSYFTNISLREFHEINQEENKTKRDLKLMVKVYNHAQKSLLYTLIIDDICKRENYTLEEFLPKACPVGPIAHKILPIVANIDDFYKKLYYDVTGKDYVDE